MFLFVCGGSPHHIVLDDLDAATVARRLRAKLAPEQTIDAIIALSPNDDQMYALPRVMRKLIQTVTALSYGTRPAEWQTGNPLTLPLPEIRRRP